MKNLKKFFAVLVVVTLMVTSIIVPASAADNFSYGDQANKLHDLGLYLGTSKEVFNADLGTTLNRETGMVMLLRVVGLEKAALDMPAADVTAALAKFKDAKTISTWAKNQVAYAVKNGLTVGTTATTFAPKASLNGKQYCTFILRQLGYTVEAGAQFEAAPTTLSEKGGLTAAEATKFAGKTALIKDDLVGISYGALSAKDKDGKVLFEKLVADKVITADAAAKAGLTTAVVSSISATNGKINVVFDKDIVATPAATDFTVSQSVYAASETPTVTTVTATVYGYTAATKTAELSVAPVTDAAAKSVCYTVTFKNGTPVTSAPITFAEVTLSSAASLSSKVVEATLSAATTATAAAGATYTVKDSAGAAINVTKAALAAYDTDNKTVLLTLASDTKAGALYTLTVGSKTVNFGGKAPETTKPTISSVSSTGYKEVLITYSEPIVLDGTTVVITEKYGARAALAVKSLKYKGKTEIVAETAEQNGTALYGITVTGTADFSGNVMDKDDARSFAGTAKDTSEIKVKAAKANNPEEAVVEFNVNIDTTTIAATAFKVEEAYGSKAVLTVSAARIATKDDKDAYGVALDETKAKKHVVITIPGAKSSSLYKVTVSGLKSEAGIGMSSTSSETYTSFQGVEKPTTPHTVNSASATSNTLVTVTFDRKVVKADAEKIENYAIAESYANKAALAVKSAELQSDEITVKLTTASMSNNLYKITVTGIKDIYGNSIKTEDSKNILTFSGKTVDPKISKINTIEYAENSDTAIVVTFNYNVGSTATDISHYSIDNSVGYPEKAETVTGATNANKVKLTLPKLTEKKIYTLTVKGLENADGVAMDTAGVTLTFVGKGNASTLPQLTGIMPLDNQTLKIYFDRDVKDSTVDGKVWDSEAKTLKTTALSYTKGATTTDLSSIVNYAYQSTANDEKNVLIVRIITDNAFTSDAIMKLSGSTVVIDPDHKDLQFVSVTADPTDIAIENVQPLNSTTLRVYFNMPVYRNAGTDALATFADVNTLKGYGAGGDKALTLSNPAAADDTNKVYDFKLSGKLVTLTTGAYYLNVNPAVKGGNTIIQDSPVNGFVGLKDEDTSTTALDHVRQFVSNTTDAADIKDVYAVMTDNKTIKVIYPESMDETSAELKTNYDLVVGTAADAAKVMMGTTAPGVSFVAADNISEIEYKDKVAVITLNTPILTTGNVYIKFATGINNATSTAQVKDGTNAIVKQFAISTTDAAKVVLSEASYDATAGTITVTMNQKFTAASAAAAAAALKITVIHSTGAVELDTADGAIVTGTTITDSKKIVITLSTAEKANLVASAVGKVEMRTESAFTGINGNSGNDDTSVVFAQ